METSTDPVDNHNFLKRLMKNAPGRKCVSLCLIFLIYICTAAIVAFLYKGFYSTFKTPDHADDSRKFSNEQASNLNSDIGNTSIQKYAFIGALICRKPFMLLCTTVTLTRLYFLTGATCFSPNYQNLIVRVGSDHWEKDGVVYGVERFILHDEFDGRYLKNNVALIKSDRIIKFGTTCQPVNIADPVITNYYKGISVSWSKWMISDHRPSQLVTQTLQLLKSEECDEYLKNEPSMDVICAFSRTNTQCKLEDEKFEVQLEESQTEAEKLEAEQTKGFAELLITFVHNAPALWDSQLPVLQRFKTIKDKLWIEIYESFGRLHGVIVIQKQLVGLWSWGLTCQKIPTVFTNLHHYSRWIQHRIHVV